MQPWWCGATNPSVMCQSLSLTFIFFHRKAFWDLLTALLPPLALPLLPCPVLPQPLEWEKQLHLLLRSNTTSVSIFYCLPLITQSPEPVSPSAALTVPLGPSGAVFITQMGTFCHLPAFALSFFRTAQFTSRAFPKWPKPNPLLQPPLTGQVRQGKLTISSQLSPGQPIPTLSAISSLFARPRLHLNRSPSWRVLSCPLSAHGGSCLPPAPQEPAPPSHRLAATKWRRRGPLTAVAAAPPGGGTRSSSSGWAPIPPGARAGNAWNGPRAAWGPEARGESGFALMPQLWQPTSSLLETLFHLNNR